MKFWDALKLKQNSGLIYKTAEDLLNKNLVPQHTKAFFKDPNMLNAAIVNYTKSKIKEWNCPECGITIRAPKKWMIQHIKYHHMKKDSKDNEPEITKINPYW